MKTTFNIFAIALFFTSIVSYGQDLTVNSGSSLTVLSGTNFYVNELAIIPSTSLTMNGPLNLSKTSTPVGESIDRVFNFSNSISNFSGNLTFYYQDSELTNSGASESDLVLRIKDGTTWSGDLVPLRNSTANTLTYNFSSATNFTAITAAKSGITLSINKLNKLAIEVYPNPVISNLTIKTTLTTETIIYSNLGQELLKTNVKNIDLSQFKTGTYLMIVKDKESNKINSYQFIKI